MAVRRYRSDFKKLSISQDCESKLTNDSFYPLRMVEDHRTEQYVKCAKVMVIFQGPVTEERSKAVSQLSQSFKNSGRLFSDNTFKAETSKSCYEKCIEEFHSYFKSRVKKACDELMNIIVIDQSISNVIQMQYYCSLAQTRQYVLLPYPPLVESSDEGPKKTGNFSQSRGGELKNVAGNFSKFSERRVSYPNYFKHLFCGWFLHDVDSHELRVEASLYIQDCFDDIREFNELFSSVWKGKDFREFYNLLDRYQDLAYCVVKIFQNPLDIVTYMSKEHFKKHYGKMSKLYVVGFIISPHIIAARVKLTYDQKSLWEMPDDLEAKDDPKVYASELVKQAKIPNKEEIDYRGVKSNRTIIAGKPIHDPEKEIHPRALGRSCHIVLGHAKNAQPLNLNYDVQCAVLREKIAVQKYTDDVRPYDLQRSMLRRIGKYWFIYLKETVVVEGFFSTCSAVETCNI